MSVQEPAGLSHRQILLVFGGLVAGMFLSALDQTVIATALPTIVGDLGGIDHLSWVVSAYLLTSTVATPLYGKLSDLYGRKALFQAAIVIFIAGSVLAGLSQSMGQLIAFRGIQGVGAGGLMAMTMAIVGDIVPPRERGRYQGIIGAVFAVASLVGPLLGGFFVEQASWRWIFYVNVPIGVGALAITAVVLNVPFHRREHAIDYTGAGLLVASVTSLLLVTVWGGNDYPWSSPVIVGLGAAGVLAGAVFLWWERRTPEPILPLRLFRDPVFTVSNAVMFILGLSMFGVVVYLPLFFQVVQGIRATSSGLLLLPLILGWSLTAFASGRVITRTGRYKAMPVAGTVLVVAGIALFATMDRGTARWTSGLFMAITGIGMGMTMQNLVLATQNAVAQRDLGTATSSLNFFRSLGSAFGAAFYGAVLTNRVAHHLGRLVPGLDLDARPLRGGPEALAALPPAARGPVIEAFELSLSTAFAWGVPVALAGAVVVLWLKELPLREQAHVGAGPREPQAS